uniref:Uncharacterized protein n=1 Tax=Arundo donax TaxID=35708 RepID=A0A0A8Z3L0_ARUDO
MSNFLLKYMVFCYFSSKYYKDKNRV